MRVDSFNSVLTTEAVAKTDKAANDQISNQNKQAFATQASEDKATLSSGSDSVTSLTKAALQPVPSREAKVEALKLAVNSAQYQLDSAKISEALSNTDI